MVAHSEIGSEFWDIPLSEKKNDLFPEDILWFLSGRSALLSIISDVKTQRSAERAYLPSWCCDSMIIPFLKSGIEVKFYPVCAKDGGIFQDVPYTEENEILLVMDYFGYADNSRFEFGEGAVIRDLTHSIFSNVHSDFDYSFGSLRKWCGFKTGGFATGVPYCSLDSDERYVSTRERAMKEKNEYISARSESKDYLKLFATAEEYLDACRIAGAVPADIEAATNMDVEFIKTRRRENASVLLDAFSEISVFQELGEQDCPMFVPIMVSENDRDNLRKHLIANEIYCPVHWPVSKYHNLDSTTEKLYKSEISLVCDQRYDEKDMCRIVDTVKKYYVK